MTVAVTACGSGPDSALGDAPTLSGQIAGWDQGSNYVVVSSIQFAGLYEQYGQLSVPIDAAGNFSVTLLSGAMVAKLAAPKEARLVTNCSGLLVIDPEEAVNASLQLTDNAPHPLRYHGLHEELPNTVVNRSGAGVSYRYVDRDLTISGTAHCKTDEVTYDVHYRKGWNREILTMGLDKIAITTDSPPQGLQWVRAYTFPPPF